MYRPDTRAFTEIYGGPRFATQAACDRAREQQVAANQKVAGFFRDVKKEERYQPDRFGACHCDMTGEKSSATYLTESQRTLQLRMAEEIRLRVRERLLDEKITSDSELIRAPLLRSAVDADPRRAEARADAHGDARSDRHRRRRPQADRTLDTTKPTVVAMDLPIVDIGAPPASPPADVAASSPPTPRADSRRAPSRRNPRRRVPRDRRSRAEPGTERRRPRKTAQSAEETAERFISYETQRIQNVLRASSAIADENVKTKIFEACMQRIQLLSNLRLLIEGSGMRSRLATAARDAQTEAERLALVARLFGDSVKPHWAPSDAADVVFDIEPAIAAEPERALRDTHRPLHRRAEEARAVSRPRADAADRGSEAVAVDASWKDSCDEEHAARSSRAARRVCAVRAGSAAAPTPTPRKSSRRPCSSARSSPTWANTPPRTSNTRRPTRSSPISRRCSTTWPSCSRARGGTPRRR